MIFGAPLALALKVPFIPLRKPGKLPGETVFADYITEYSTDRIEMHVGAVQAGQRVVLVDDLIATGGTLREWEQQHSYSLSVDFRFARCAVVGGALTCSAPGAVAGMELMKKAGGEVLECACVIELPELKGRDRLVGVPLFVLVEKAENTDE